MVYHLFDMAVINGFILFKEHQAQFPDNEALKRPSQYSLGDFWEEIVRQLCGLPDYGSPPENTMVKSPPSTPEEFTTVHIPVFSDTKRHCVVCYKEGRGDFRVRSYCSAPQCQKYMHVSKGWDCFAVFHSKKYHRQILLMFIPMFSDVVFLKNIRKKTNFFYLVAFIFVSGNSCDLVLVFSGRTLVS